MANRPRPDECYRLNINIRLAVKKRVLGDFQKCPPCNGRGWFEEKPIIREGQFTWPMPIRFDCVTCSGKGMVAKEVEPWYLRGKESANGN